MSAKEVAQRLYFFPKPTRWSRGIGTELPEEFRKFWREWKVQERAPVHYIPKEGMFEKNYYGEVKPIQNVPLPLRFPPEMHKGIWGGEAVVQGFIKKSHYRRRVPRFWVPRLQRSVLYSEVLDTYMKTIVTGRTIDLIHSHYGFDYYLLKTPACDLVTELAVGIKRKILIALADKTLYPDDPVKREEVYDKYKQFLEPYTREEIEWYGLTFKEACKKWIKQKQLVLQPVPHKLALRAELIAELQEAKISGMEEAEKSAESQSWLSKINPFAKGS